MNSEIIEVKANFGDGKVKMKVISRELLSEFQKKHLSSLKRDEAIKYGNINGWKVLDIED